MKLAVISDLHLGVGGPEDEFGHDDFEFLQFLAFLEANFEKIILLGDIWETLTAAARAQVEEIKRAQAKHREIHKRFQKQQYTYVFGNHDLVAKKHSGALEQFTLEADGVRILFAHGHQSDLWCSKAKCFSEAAMRVGAWLTRRGMKSVYRALAAIEQQRDRTNHYIKRWAWNQDFDIVVTGHTHISERTEKGHQLFLNSGHCSYGQFHFLALDTKQDVYSVHAGF